MEPNAVVLADQNIADDNAGLFDETGRRDRRFDALKGVDHA